MTLICFAAFNIACCVQVHVSILAEMLLVDGYAALLCPLACILTEERGVGQTHTEITVLLLLQSFKMFNQATHTESPVLQPTVHQFAGLPHLCGKNNPIIEINCSIIGCFHIILLFYHKIREENLNNSWDNISSIKKPFP